MYESVSCTMSVVHPVNRTMSALGQPITGSNGVNAGCVLAATLANRRVMSCGLAGKSWICGQGAKWGRHGRHVTAE